MKNSLKHIKRIGFIISFVFMTAGANAQIVFEEDVDDVPAAPIDGFLGVGLVAGAYLIIRKKYSSDT